MIFTEKRVKASGPKNAKLAVIGMSPQKTELEIGKPFVGASGIEFDKALATNKVSRASVYVTNLCEFYIDDNDLYSVPREILEVERQRVFDELNRIQPNCLMILGAQTIALLQEGYCGPFGSKTQRKASSKWAITKWRGSIMELTLPDTGRVQKCVASMHPANFVRGQWKWLPLFKYIDVPRAVTQSGFPEIKLHPRECIVGPSFHQAREFLLESLAHPWVSIDYEGRDHISCLGVGFTSSCAMSIPLSRVGSPVFYDINEEVELWRLWTRLLESQKVKKIAQNAAFEWIKSWNYGIYPNPLGFDTMLAHHCLYPDWGGAEDEWSRTRRNIDNPGHGLALITSQYTDQPYYKDDGRHWLPEYGEEAFWRYNALDVMITFESAMKMMEELQRANLTQVYKRNYLDKFEKTIQMEWTGIKIDRGRVAELRVEVSKELREVTQTLSDKTGCRIIVRAESGPVRRSAEIQSLNLGSPKQLQAWLQKRGYRIPINRRTGKPTVDKDTIAKLAIQHDDETLGLIQRLRRLVDFESDVLNQRTDSNGIMHAHWKLGGTNGTRWSSTKSVIDGTGRNFQNLDREGPARSLFLPA